MQVVVGTDGSKYGRWALEWIARLPLAEPPTVKVIHVVDLRALRAPLMLQPVVTGTERYLKAEVTKLLAGAKRTRHEAAALLKSLRLKGRVVTERGPVARTIVKAAKRGVHRIRQPRYLQRPRPVGQAPDETTLLQSRDQAMDARLAAQIERVLHLVEGGRNPALLHAFVDEHQKFMLLAREHGGLPSGESEQRLNHL